MRSLRTLALALLALAGCSSVPVELRRDGIPFETLPPQSLRRGECAMFLWAPEPGREPRRIMMVAGDPVYARVRVGSRSFDFEASEEAGDPIGGIHPRMTFQGYGASFSLDLTFAQSPQLQEGFIVKGGSLSYTSLSGWTAVMAVAGVVACER